MASSVWKTGFTHEDPYRGAGHVKDAMAKSKDGAGRPERPGAMGALPSVGSSYQGSCSPRVSMVVKSSMQSLRATAAFFFF